MGQLMGSAPDGVASFTHADGSLYHYWLRSYRGDFSWDITGRYLERIPPPDVRYHVDFLDIPKRARVMVVGMAVSCPTCGAGSGVQCKRPSEHQSPFKDMHAARKDKADAVFYWQYGADARVSSDRYGRPVIIEGLDRATERALLHEHRLGCEAELRRKGVVLPLVPINSVDPAAMENRPAPLVAGTDKSQMQLW